MFGRWRYRVNNLGFFYDRAFSSRVCSESLSLVYSPMKKRAYDRTYHIACNTVWRNELFDVLRPSSLNFLPSSFAIFRMQGRKHCIGHFQVNMNPMDGVIVTWSVRNFRGRKISSPTSLDGSKNGIYLVRSIQDLCSIVLVQVTEHAALDPRNDDHENAVVHYMENYIVFFCTPRTSVSKVSWYLPHVQVTVKRYLNDQWIDRKTTQFSERHRKLRTATFFGTSITLRRLSTLQWVIVTPTDRESNLMKDWILV